MLGHDAADLDDGRFLEGVGADHRRAHLAGDGDDGDAVQLGVGDAGDQVGGTGPAGCHTDTHLSGGSGVSLGGESPALLLPRQDHPDLVPEPRQGLVQRDAGPAWKGKNHLHPVIHQRLDHNIRPAGRLGRCWLAGSSFVFVVNRCHRDDLLRCLAA